MEENFAKCYNLSTVSFWQTRLHINITGLAIRMLSVGF